MNTALDSLRNISEKCHDMLCRLNKGTVSDIELLSLIFNIREEAAKRYNKCSKELGLCDKDYDLINELNNI